LGRGGILMLGQKRKEEGLEGEDERELKRKSM